MTYDEECQIFSMICNKFFRELAEQHNCNLEDISIQFRLGEISWVIERRSPHSFSNPNPVEEAMRDVLEKIKEEQRCKHTYLFVGMEGDTYCSDCGERVINPSENSMTRSSGDVFLDLGLKDLRGGR